MLTTLYCDASFCPVTLAGGWAVWLRSNSGRIVESGKTPEYVVNSNDAELSAIFAGIYRAVTQWSETEAILVRSDCQSALAQMEDPSRAYQPETRKLATKIRKLREKHNVKLISRWVKGHQKVAKTDAWINNQVDRMAGEQMREQRKKATVAGLHRDTERQNRTPVNCILRSEASGLAETVGKLHENWKQMLEEGEKPREP